MTKKPVDIRHHQKLTKPIESKNNSLSLLKTTEIPSNNSLGIEETQSTADETDIKSADFINQILLGALNIN